jgi:hypothetical protein
VWNRPPWDAPQPPPPIVTQSVHNISDRAAIVELQRVGLANVEQMRALNERFARWLLANCTMEAIVAPHSGALSDCE